MCSSSDDEIGELPVAFVVKRPGSSLSQADVISFVASQVIYSFVSVLYALADALVSTLQLSPLGGLLGNSRKNQEQKNIMNFFAE